MKCYLSLLMLKEIKCPLCSPTSQSAVVFTEVRLACADQGCVHNDRHASRDANPTAVKNKHTHKLLFDCASLCICFLLKQPVYLSTRLAGPLEGSGCGCCFTPSLILLPLDHCEEKMDKRGLI